MCDGRTAHYRARLQTTDFRFRFGLTFHNECSANSEPPFIGVCRTKHLNTWCTAALPSQTSPVGCICDQPLATSCSYHDPNVRCDVRPSCLLCCWSDGLELVARQSAGSGKFSELLSAGSQDFSTFSSYWRTQRVITQRLSDHCAI